MTTLLAQEAAMEANCLVQVAQWAFALAAVVEEHWIGL
jgi:hypothetical protein